MTQDTVEQIIGRLATDERFRRRFVQDPARTIEEIVRCGRELNECERRALMRLDGRRLGRLAEAIEPSLVKADLSGGQQYT